MRLERKRPRRHSKALETLSTGQLWQGVLSMPPTASEDEAHCVRGHDCTRGSRKMTLGISCERRVQILSGRHCGRHGKFLASLVAKAATPSSAPAKPGTQDHAWMQRRCGSDVYYMEEQRNCDNPLPRSDSPQMGNKINVGKNINTEITSPHRNANYPSGHLARVAHIFLVAGSCETGVLVA